DAMGRSPSHRDAELRHAITRNQENRMAIDYHLLSSLSSTLEDVVRRLGEVARSADDDNDPVIDLLEVERQLTTASRRLAKITRPR
ncbi:MAG: hypothetical protein OEZ14_12210, partial [Acidimicrobiia bacterium]|nr:hypothetical protein [Acidimicrobiia bacterium]